MSMYVRETVPFNRMNQKGANGHKTNSRLSGYIQSSRVQPLPGGGAAAFGRDNVDLVLVLHPGPATQRCGLYAYHGCRDTLGVPGPYTFAGKNRTSSV